MNPIVTPITPDGMCGLDESGRVVCVKPEEDGSLTPHFLDDVRDQTCPICRKGWDITTESFADQRREPYFDRTCHESCWRGFLALHEAMFWFDMFTDLNVRFDIREAPNEDSNGMNLPWYEITLHDYREKLMVGTRKNAYEISAFGVPDLTPIFAEKEASKYHPGGRFVISAWDASSAKEYVGAIIELLTKNEN